MKRKMKWVRAVVAAMTMGSVLAINVGCNATSDSSELNATDAGTSSGTEATDGAQADTLVASETEEEEPEPVETEITVSLAGDCSLGKLATHPEEVSLWAYYDEYGEDYFFQNVKDIFEADSMTLVNFEGVLTDSDDLVTKAYNIKGRPEFIGILPAASIEAVTFGNNHRIDYGVQGYTDTIALFDEYGITWAYDDNYAIYETPEGITIGYVSVSEVDDGTGVEQYLQDGIAYLKEQDVDLIFCACHWGIERDYYPNDYQQELGKKCIDWGADLVIGDHPHVLQGFEYYNGAYIIYSLGNFCFGANRNPDDKNSMIVQASFHFTDGELDEEPVLTVIPCSISSVTTTNDFCPTPLTGESGAEVISLLNEYSSPFGVTIDENGVLSHP